MKDMRPAPHSSRLAELAGSATSESSGGSQAEGRARLRRRAVAGGLAVAALAVIIGPHLLDANRISSVADRAAEGAGGSPVLGVEACPVELDESWILQSPAPVELASAVVCDYPAGRPGAVPSIGVLPRSQLAGLNVDLREHSAPYEPPVALPPIAEPHRVNPSPPKVRVLVGLTIAGQRVALTGTHDPGIYHWYGATPPARWRPSLATQQLLADDLPS